MSDGNGGFGDFEVFGEEFNQGVVSLAAVGFGTKINSELAGGGFDNFFLRGAGFDDNGIFHGYII